ncbi:MAG: hypothetical protein HOE86_24155 [Gemmatimonadetes bacterium]|nr:hypothetical protein [Gemmatimonadota bacterium]
MRADDQAKPTMISFYYDRVAWPLWRGPIMHSPLGVPASFATTDFSELTSEVVARGLHEFLPRIKPVGRDDDGSMIPLGAPMTTRLPAGFDAEALRQKLEDPSFELRIELHGQAENRHPQ